MLRTVLAAIGGMALVFGTTGPTSASDNSPAPQIAQAGKDLNFGSGRQGGSQYPVTVAISQVLEELPGINRISLQPGGSDGNIIAVETGKSDIAISMSVSLVKGRNGAKPFPKPTEDVLQLVTLHGFHVVALVAEDSPIKNYRDLAGKKVNLGPAGFSITTIGHDVFDQLGIRDQIDFGYLAIGQAVQSFRDGHVDAMFYAPSARYGPFMQLAQTRGIRALQMPEDLMKTMLEENSSFYRTTWPKSRDAYPKLANQIEVLGYPNILVAHRDRVSDDQAYAIVKAIAENMERIEIGDPSLKDLEPKDLAIQVGSPFHPGAVRYFKERGWM